MIDAPIVALAQALGASLKGRGLRIATAESCTGGLVAGAITAIAGSSDWFEFGFVVYANRAKTSLLGVPERVLNEHGAVSEAAARAMAEGALASSGADLALAVTGVAGPGGGSPEKPVGTVCFAWAARGGPTTSLTRHFAGGRADVRRASVEVALQGALERVIGPTGRCQPSEK
jgi:nicotinamide-nucleotide amidase